MVRSRIGIVIPSYNEGKTVGSVIDSVSKYGTAIVVDDGSIDDTADVALEHGANLVRHPKNLGYDKAIDSGLHKALSLGCEFAITIDADGQHDSNQIDAIVNLLFSGCDMVLGVRDKKARFSEKLFSLVGKKLWGMSDPLCGLKAYRILIYSRIGSFGTFKSIGTQLAVTAILDGCKFKEVPVKTRTRSDNPRFGNLFFANSKILIALFILIFLTVTKRLGHLRMMN